MVQFAYMSTSTKKEQHEGVSNHHPLSPTIMEKGLTYNEQGVVNGYCNGRFSVMEIDRKTACDLIITHHYSGKVARTSNVHLGVYKEDELVGVLQFGHMMNTALRTKVVAGTAENQYLELSRMWIADSAGRNSESQAIACAIRFIKHRYPAVKWLQSYADERCKNLGLVYQACSFDYYGERKSVFYLLDGEVYHNLLMKVKKGSKLWCSSAEYLQANKHNAEKMSLRQFRYIKFLDQSWKKRCLLVERPYPKYYRENMRPDKTKIFRGKRVSNGEWCVGRLVKDGKTIIGLTDSDSTRIVDLNTIGEFIGLRDKNEREIYVGDIVDFMEHYPNGKEQKHRGHVIDTHDFKHFAVELNYGTEFEDWWYFTSEQCDIEVVGNIFDNPEMTEGGYA